MRYISCLCLCGALFATEPNAATKNWWVHTTALSNDSMKGREAGTEEYQRAARYVAIQFEKAGLKPAGEKGYFQGVPLHQVRFDPGVSTAELIRAGSATKLKWLQQIAFRMQEQLPGGLEAPLVFAGTGEAPVGFQATGKIIVQLTGHTSRAVPGGAVAMLGIDNPDAAETPRWPVQYLVSMRLAENKAAAPSAMAFRFNPAEAEVLFAGSGHTYKELLEAARADRPLPWFELPSRLKVSLATKASDVSSDNVLAVLPGSDPALSNEYVAISAHLDGYGLGEAWGKDNIYNGSFDDAAYVATLIDFAEKLKAAGRVTRRSILFVVVTAEEKGMLGSSYYARHLTVPKDHIVANVNLDQLRPIFPLKTLTMLALNESTLGETARRVAGTMGIQIRADLEPARNLLRRSDHWNFMQIGVPAAGFIFGYEKGTPDEAAYREWYAKRYHSPLDDLNQPWLPEAADKFNMFFGALVEDIANAQEKPKWLPGSSFTGKQ